MRPRVGTDIWAEHVFVSKYTALQHGLYRTRFMTWRAESLLTETVPANCDNGAGKITLERAALDASELNKDLCGL